MQKILKDKNFQILGYLEESSNGDKVLKDRNFQIVGYYDAKNDVTKTRNFQIFGYGDLLVALLFIRA